MMRVGKDMKKNNSNSIRFLRTGIAGVSGLLIGEILEVEGFFHFFVVLSVFVLVSMLIDAGVKYNYIKGRSIIGWVVFAVLVIIFSYLRAQTSHSFLPLNINNHSLFF